MENGYTNSRKLEENFSSIFDNKGIFAAVAEKSFNNFKSKFNKKTVNQQNLHYFAVGHTFKNIDTKKIFNFQLSENDRDIIPTEYLALQQSKFHFGEFEKTIIFKDGTKKNIRIDNFQFLIDSIRNINAHYIHNFDFLELRKIDNRIIVFLKESFELALIQGIFSKMCGNRKKKLKVDFLDNKEKDEILSQILANKDTELKKFIQEIFYQTLYLMPEKGWSGDKKEWYKNKKEFLDKYLTTKDDWIDWILFNNVESSLTWKLNPKGDGTVNNHTHIVMEIPQGKYLSFEGCLFMLSMFLYANEANYLIPKLKGFKKNTNSQDAAKLDTFRFYAKKFKSQDIDSEHNSLVKFRDMVQYLGKFPVSWNKVLHTNLFYVDDLKNNIMEYEIKRYYGTNQPNDFIIYAKSVLWGNLNQDKSVIEQYNRISSENKEKYNLIINQNPVYSNNLLSIKDIENEQKKLAERHQLTNEEKSKLIKYEKSLDKLRYKNGKLIKSKEYLVNPNTEKFKKRIKSNLLFQSNGRNNDRFMEFATRFLAEINYFGVDARFKMYQYYYTEDEQDAINEKRNTLSTKDFDKIHFHDGKQTYFSTYHDHLQLYPDWDMPFVVQNNAIYIQIENVTQTICLQKDLLSILLEHALYSELPENAGKELLFDYCQYKRESYEAGKTLLETENKISKEKKTELKKLFPKRILHHYCPSEQNYTITENAFQRYLKIAERAEELFAEKKKQAQSENTLDLFLKKNTGKQFKLRFIYRACQLMYFREQYNVQKEVSAELEKNEGIIKNKVHEYGHHKKYNITRDEYNDFSKWMYAFDKVPQYKNQLRNLLEEKYFFENEQFKKLFESSQTLEQLYCTTKSNYKKWLENHSSISSKERFQWSKDYAECMENGTVFINLYHFMNLAIDNGVVKKKDNKIDHPYWENHKYLYESFYQVNPEKNERTNDDRNFYFKLQKNKYEDCLLYEIALQYLHADKRLRKKSYNHLSEILVQNIKVEVKDYKNVTYTVTVPFKDLEKFAQIQALEGMKNDKDYKILKNLPTYLHNVSVNNEQVNSIKDMVAEFKLNRNITLAHLCLLNNHLITQQGRFTNCIMSMEEYFIWKNKLTLNDSATIEKNRLDMNDIPGFKDYFSIPDSSSRNVQKYENPRNSAFHMNLPLHKTYKAVFKEIENKFVNQELKKEKYMNLKQCPYMLRETLEVFMNQIHDEIKIKPDNRDTEEQRKQKREEAENKFYKGLFK